MPRHTERILRLGMRSDGERAIGAGVGGKGDNNFFLQFCFINYRFISRAVQLALVTFLPSQARLRRRDKMSAGNV